MKSLLCIVVCILVTFLSCDARTINQLPRVLKTECPKYQENQTDCSQCPAIQMDYSKCPAVEIKEIQVIKEVPVIKEVEVIKEFRCSEDGPHPSPDSLPGPLGFTVELSQDTSLSHNTAVTFDRVLVDSSASFVPLLGTFQCPDDDVYMMSWSVQATQGRVQASLVLQGEPVKYGPLTRDMGAATGSGTATMASILKCTRGAYAWVKAIAWPDSEACNKVEAVYSSITGYKIFRDGDEDASAFTAEMSQNVSTSNPVYDRVIVNIGEQYDGDTGEFVCHTNGVYVFIVSNHIVTTSTSGTNTFLMKNGDAVCYSAYARHTGSGSVTDTGTATGTCIVECSVGDVITVTSTSATHLAQAASFSGFLLNTPGSGQRAFSATVASGSNEYVNNQKLLFLDVLTNVGGRYFPNTGLYVCDDSELYLFYATVRIKSESLGRAGELRIMSAIDGEEKEEKRGPRSGEVLSAAISDSTSSQVVVRCVPDMAVYVKAVVLGSENQFYHSNYATFGGFRLPSN